MLLPNGFQLDEEIFKTGGSATVHECVKEGVRYAIKLFTKNLDQYFHEVHINVVELIDHFELLENNAIVLEHCQYDLKFCLQNYNLSIEERLILFGQIGSAFKAIQEDLKRIGFQFQHRDIKPENLMIGEGNKIKLIDFGESRIIAQNSDTYEYIPSTQLCGTPGYMDPMMEYMNAGFTEKSDLWSLGATFYYILTNRQLEISKSEVNAAAKNVPFAQKKSYKIKKIQQLIEFQITQYIEIDDCKKLLRNLLSIDTQDRYDWWQLFSDPYMVQLMDKTSFVQCESFGRKQIIRLRHDLKYTFVSKSLKDKAGPHFSQLLKAVIKRGLYQFQIAQEMLEFFSQIKEQHSDFLENWQEFEKCNYLLHLRSLLFFYSYHQIFKELKCQQGKEQMNKDILNDLNRTRNSLILERIQLQMYYLFDCVRKSLVGNGLEAKLIKLQKESDNDDYPGLLEFSLDEKIHFSYQKYDKKNVLNNPEYFEKEEFYEILLKYMIVCIKCCLKNYQVLKKNQTIFLKKLALWCDYEKNNNIFQILENLDFKQSKMQILFSILDDFNYLYEVLDAKSIFNTYFYFEIKHSAKSKNEIDVIENIKNYLSRNCPGKLCLTIKMNDWNHQNIILNLKCQQALFKIWCFEDGIANFKYMIKNRIQYAIQNS